MTLCDTCGNEYGDREARCPYCGAPRVFSGEGRKRRPRRSTVLHLKEGLPTVDEARARLENQIQSARSSGLRVIKVIHGYGSGGTGGAIRPSIRGLLNRLRTQGQIRHFVPGEDFSTQHALTQRLLNDFPELLTDSDLNRTNEGITIVVL